MIKIITEHDNLGRLLRQEPERPHFDCAMRGICKKCRVKLLSGLWLVDGKSVKAPAEALSCRCRLLGERGEVEYEPAPEKGRISLDWSLERPLPVLPEAVIGIDLGTTTLAAVKIQQGKVLARAGMMNPQAAFGADVVSRIAAAAEHLPQLTAMIRRAVDLLLDELGMMDVQRIALAGNTVMTSLFHGVDPTPIGTAPFTPRQRFFPVIQWRAVSLYTMPCISGFLGGDITAGFYETALRPGEMLVDLGTNCEILFRTPSGVLGTSAAAGPAFEQQGMSAVPGAVSHLFSLNDFSVIGNISPKGLCGSALVDFLAVARRENVLDSTGHYIAQTDFPFAISEADTAELIKAKASVHAGITVLEAYAGVRAEHIRLAGGFARELDLENAVAIGLLPERDYSVAGNTSLAGACRLALMPQLNGELETLAEMPEELPLGNLPDFPEQFIAGLSLP